MVDARRIKNVSLRRSFSLPTNCDSVTKPCLRQDFSQHPFHGFFLPKRPPIFLTALAGFCASDLAPPGTNPPAQPSCDLSMPAARPRTSGTNLGSAVVPSIMKGMVVPFLQLPPPLLPSKPPKPFA